jgi:hypothetical protein
MAATSAERLSVNSDKDEDRTGFYGRAVFTARVRWLLDSVAAKLIVIGRRRSKR